MPRVRSSDIGPNDPAIKYNATWHPALDPNQGGTLGCLISKVKNAIFYLPISLVAACINPRSESWPVNSDLIRTPDGVVLGVRIETSEKKDEPLHPKYVIFCNQLGTNAQGAGAFVASLKRRGFSVVLFNYRGLGSTWSPKDLVIDGESVYQYLVNHHKIPPENIDFYGQSLGGAVAASVKALHPESTGKYVGDRTFRSIFHVASEFFTISSFGPLVQRISSVFSRIITACIAYPLYWLGLDLDVERALRLMRGEKKIFFLSSDSMLHGFASLHHVRPAEEIVRITDGSHFPNIAYQYISREDKSVVSAADVAVDFLAGI